MQTFKIKISTRQILADTITPVSVYLKVRDIFPNAILLESSDYHGSKGSYSYICMEPMAEFMVEGKTISRRMPCQPSEETEIKNQNDVVEGLQNFINSFKVEGEPGTTNGVFGYSAYDAVQYFEDINLNASKNEGNSIPELRYAFYKYIIAVNHFQNTLTIHENLLDNQQDNLEEIISLLNNRNFATYPFDPRGTETSEISDDDYMQMVSRGKEHCQLGDVFQIVLSRRFSREFQGDEFNVYRQLRSINPSPYLFYFDYGNYRIFGSSPEAQIEISENKAYIHPIAGTFRRTGNDQEDKELALKLMEDEKENAEHVMLVDLARNDLSRNASDVKVETYREIQYYSHVLHMVSIVSGELAKDTKTVRVMADTFPAGTLSGAPKYKAMELIDKYEKSSRGFYGGCIGYLGFNGDCNQAIMIRSFMSKNNTLYYQAGAGIVSASVEENELNEVNNKLMALKSAIDLAKNN